MPTNTILLASKNGVTVGPSPVELAQLNLTTYRDIRLSVVNWSGSPASVTISVSHVDQPGTPNSNLITSLDSFTLAPGDSASKVYEVPGEVVVFGAEPDPAQTAGIQVDFTIYGRTD